MQLKFKADAQGDFFTVAKARVNAYFKEDNRSKRTNFFGYAKAVFFILVFTSLYLFLFSGTEYAGFFIAAYALLGFTQMCIVLNLGHEAVHGSFSRFKFVN